MPGRPPFLRSVELATAAPTEGYPFDIPAVRALAEGHAFDQVTVLVGDNGSGKSTLVEALAVTAGSNAEGGGRNLRFQTLATHSQLHDHLRPRWKVQPRWGWFLRAETFSGMASHSTVDRGLAATSPGLHERSPARSFLALLESHCASPSSYLMDEPQSAPSVQGQLQLLRLINDATASDSQFVVATHSPLLMRAPAATILDIDADGITCREWDDLVVAMWRRFLAAAERVLDVLLAADLDDHERPT